MIMKSLLVMTHLSMELVKYVRNLNDAIVQ